MFRLKKIPYYLRFIVWFLPKIRKPFDAILLREIIVRCNPDLKLKMKRPIDALVTKETIGDDAYRLHKLTNAKLIVDVGAAFGDFCIFAAWKFPKAQVLGFEPDQKAYSLLKENIQNNRIINVKIWNLAIGRGRACFGTNMGVRNSIYKKNKTYQKIRLKNLNNFIGDKKIDLLKLDCEGAELNILRSMGKKLQDIKNISLEYHNNLLKDEDLLIADLLSKNNFKIEFKKDPYNRDIGYIYACNGLFLR